MVKWDIQTLEYSLASAFKILILRNTECAHIFITIYIYLQQLFHLLSPHNTQKIRVPYSVKFWRGKILMNCYSLKY